ncbi:MAG: tRNA isopentenyl-2-thiomethyl-A-37 hydroxylase MiaE [Acidobacteriota bacterium]
MADLETIRAELPLLTATPTAWAELAAAHLDEFLADHAVCEQQAALFGLSLIGHYPADDELVERMGALAAEEVAHLRRVHVLLRHRGQSISRRRGNPWVQGLRQRVEKAREDLLKVDRLLVGALIEARSCERFSTLLVQIRDSEPEVARLLQDLGPAEKRHWEMFFHLAEREIDPLQLQTRWQGWLEHEAELSRRGGREPTVHG